MRCCLATSAGAEWSGLYGRIGAVEREQAPVARPIAAKVLGRQLTIRRATRTIVAVTLIVTIGGGVTIWLLDHKEFPDLGTSLWWAVQTVTTVGYGDVVPHETVGRVIGTVVMVTGIGFIAVMTAAVTASLIEQARRRQESTQVDPSVQLERIEARLATIEGALARRGQPSASGPESGADEPT
jgi:voltage-gated potassium channel